MDQPTSTSKVAVVPKPPVPPVNVEQLFGSNQELRLNFRGQEYRLRITRQGKLILTK